MALTWNDFRSNSDDWSEFEVVPSVGWQLLIAWVTAQSVSPSLVRVVDEAQSPEVVEVVETIGDTIQRVLREIEPAERDEFDEMNDGYLIDAGADPLPRSASVRLRLPSGVRDMEELCELIGAATPEVGSHPSAMTSALREVLPQIYQGSASPRTDSAR